jgi:hypothetical protein
MKKSLSFKKIHAHRHIFDQCIPSSHEFKKTEDNVYLVSLTAMTQKQEDAAQDNSGVSGFQDSPHFYPVSSFRVNETGTNVSFPERLRRCAETPARKSR